jgi:hypothetical protein
MAAFLTWLLQLGRTTEFPDRVREYETRFLNQVRGQPNDARVAANMAVLAAAFAQIGEYLSDVWPEWESEVKQFVEGDVPTILTSMMQSVREQRPIELFWNTLQELVACHQVRLDGSEEGNAPIIGREVRTGLAGIGGICCVSTELALAEVQRCLRDQNRPCLPLRVTEIPELLRKVGKLVDRAGTPIDPQGKGTITGQHRIAGESKRGFYIQRTAGRNAGDPEQNTDDKEPAWNGVTAVTGRKGGCDGAVTAELRR